MAILKRITIYKRVIIDVLDDPDNALFKNQQTTDVQIMLLLRYLSNFWRALECH